MLDKHNIEITYLSTDNARSYFFTSQLDFFFSSIHNIGIRLNKYDLW